MAIRHAALALAVSLCLTSVAAAQSATTISTTTTTKGKSEVVREKSRVQAVYGQKPTSTSGTADTTEVSGIAGTAPGTGTTVGTRATESMNNTPPAREMGRETGVVQTTTTVVTEPGPASVNASENARIATQYPGAMADYRHMTGAGRYHIDTNVLDVNHDGFLSREEASANIALNNQFATIDANADGRIATDELRGWISAGGLRTSLPLHDALSGVGSASAFQMLDLNGDGVLTSREAAVQTRLGARFRSLDRNRDGRLSQAEYDAWTSAGKR